MLFMVITRMDGTCKTEIRTWIATTTAAMARLERIWKSNISFHTKFNLYKSLVISILLYGSWTLLIGAEGRIQASQNKYFSKLLSITYWEHKHNDHVRSKVKNLVVRQESLLVTIKYRKMSWFGDITQINGLCKTIIQENYCRWTQAGMAAQSWSDNIKVWTNRTMPKLLRANASRLSWRR